MKKILITGAGTGIGQATAIRLAQDNSQLFLIGRRLEKLEYTKKLMLKNNSNCEVSCLALDVSDEKAVGNFFKTAPLFDICVNNAAVEGARGEVQELTTKQFDDVFNINMRALFQFCSLEVKAMRQNQKQGVIINISSIAGIIGIPSSSLYCASKAAVIGFTKTIAAEQAPFGIRINTICPGAIETPMLERILGADMKTMGARYPIGRIGKPEEIAEAVAYLTNENSKFVIGHSLILDGGATIG